MQHTSSKQQEQLNTSVNKTTATQQYYDLQQNLSFHSAYNEFQQVVPNLFIGGQISSLNIQKLREHNITRVLKVNGIESSMNFKSFGIQLKIIDMDDMPDFDILPYFDEAQQFIHASVGNNEGVLVVCTAGISRSAAVVISYLIKFQKMTYDQAYQVTKQARMYIKPNPGFERILKAYDRKLNCQLCNLTKQTPWFDQYTVSQKSFQVLICDQCDGPMVVYVKEHKQALSTEELIQAFNLCEQVGNDIYGLNNWFVDGNQRTIGDHFHWHVRSYKDNPIQATLKARNTPALITLNSDIFSLDLLKQESLRLLQQHLEGQIFSIQDKSVQVLEKWRENCILESTVRLRHEDLVVIRQEIKDGKTVIARIHYRLKVGEITDDDDILAKL